jgi:hypothetical protein
MKAQLALRSAPGASGRGRLPLTVVKRRHYSVRVYACKVVFAIRKHGNRVPPRDIEQRPNEHHGTDEQALCAATIGGTARVHLQPPGQVHRAR